ncbi:hypothetical protein BDR07DRAFT_1377699 [Suillus spraguei]|nr:hypothetical protein BDR07DRAFT_1377699 [Suillus spraguei]
MPESLEGSLIMILICALNLKALFQQYHSVTPKSGSPRTGKIAVADIFATRGKYRNANAISGKRHLVRPSHPPRKKAHTSTPGVLSANTSTAGMTDITSGAISAGVRPTKANTPAITGEHPSPEDTELVPETKCLTVLARWFLCDRVH